SGSSIRPGQFGYGRVPQNRHTRHTRRHNTTTTDSLDALNVNSSSHVDKAQGEREQIISDTVTREQKEYEKKMEAADVESDAASDGEPHRRVERVREREPNAHLRPLTQRHVARDRRVDGRTSRQVPRSYTHTIHRSHTPREPPPYGIHTPTNPNPEPWVLQNAAQPSRNEAEREWRPPAATHNYRCSGRDREYR
ncbi:hypothetical protein M9458_033604, partial [Cirrhinus mrigala]